MLEAKKRLSRLLQKERRRYQRGDWQAISRLKDSGKIGAMWKKLKPNKVEDDGTWDYNQMLEDGIRAVAQVGFPHDEVSSQAWARELASFTHTPQHISDEIMDSPELWKLKRCKATGEDGWCEELLMLLKRMGKFLFCGFEKCFQVDGNVWNNSSISKRLLGETYFETWQDWRHPQRI